MDLAHRLGIAPVDIELLPSANLGDRFTVVLATNRRARVYVYEVSLAGELALRSSGERDGGHEFVPPPGIDV